MDLSLYGTVRVAAVYDGRVVQNKLPVLIEEIDTIDWVSVLQVSVTSNEIIILGEQRMIQLPKLPATFFQSLGCV